MDFEIKDFYTMPDLLKIIEMLRDKDNGCDWDKIQTHESIRQNFIEETYEAVDAIDKKDKELLQEELGDVLLQVLLHAQFEREEGSFDFGDVVNALAAKLVLRHPHIFKGVKVNGVEDVLDNWEEIKKASHGHTTVSRTLQAVPKSFPALMYTQKVQKRVQAGKLPVPDIKDEADNIRARLDKLESSQPDGEEKKRILQDILFSAVNITRQRGLDSEEILASRSNDFVKIFDKFEDLALKKGLEFGIINPVTVKELWAQAEDLAKDEM